MNPESLNLHQPQFINLHLSSIVRPRPIRLGPIPNPSCDWEELRSTLTPNMGHGMSWYLRFGTTGPDNGTYITVSAIFCNHLLRRNLDPLGVYKPVPPIIRDGHGRFQVGHRQRISNRSKPTKDQVHSTKILGQKASISEVHEGSLLFTVLLFTGKAMLEV